MIDPRSTHRPSAPAWMRGWLAAAAAYNIAWGTVMAVAPVWSMRALGVTPSGTELWPQLWACIGMIVGVYGVGYAIAARNPLRHWPIVLVGLLGKVLGPIGFVDAAVRGLLPWSMGVTILTNDLLWWIPFSLILWRAALASQPAPPADPVSINEALDTLRDEQGRSLRSITDDAPTLVVLLRHTGCTFCRETLARLATQRSRLQALGVRLAVVGMTDQASELRALADRFDLRDASFFADPTRLLYRALELPRGRFLQLFGPIVWIRGAAAMLRGVGIGGLRGDGFQMPGAAFVHRGRVVKSYRYRTAADRPDFAEWTCPAT